MPDGMAQISTMVSVRPVVQPFLQMVFSIGLGDESDICASPQLRLPEERLLHRKPAQSQCHQLRGRQALAALS